MIIHTPGIIPGLPGERSIAVLKDDTHLSRWIEQHHCLGADLSCPPIKLIPLVLDLIPEGSTVIDAGASLGDHASSYATKAGTVHAFEPQVEPFECLRQNCADLPNVVLHNCGLSDRVASLKIKREENAGASHIDADGDVPVEGNAMAELGSAAFVGLDRLVQQGTQNNLKILRRLIDANDVLLVSLHRLRDFRAEHVGRHSLQAKPGQGERKA